MKIIWFWLVLLALACAGCATMPTPTNAAGSIYAPEQFDRDERNPVLQCKPAGMPGGLDPTHAVDNARFRNASDRVSAGDRLRLAVAGDTDLLTGNYIVGADGRLRLPGNVTLQAEGVSLERLQGDVAERLLQGHLVRPIANGVRLQQVEQAAISVSVSGAVFEPGTVKAGERQPDVRNLSISNVVAGDLNAGRSLSTALRAAGGLRPDGDPAGIYVIRDASWTRVDLTGALNGDLNNDFLLASGDQVLVMSVGCFQPRLARPSPITAPGIRVFMSNLSRPAASNSSSAIDSTSTSLPYGTRLLQGLISANCVGGSAMNAGRSSVLISKNPVTGQSVVIARSVERLVRNADRDAYNPYLLPGDAIACYDSLAMNLRDVVTTLSEAVTPYVLFRGANR